MCGVFGLSTKNLQGQSDKYVSLVERLLILSESRGKESSGLAYKIMNETEVFSHKLASRASEFLQNDLTKIYVDQFKKKISGKKS